MLALLFFNDKAVIVAGDGSISESIKFISYIPYLVLIIIATGLNLLALFSYKIRVFQMRTAALAAIFCVALQIWLLVDFLVTKDEMVFRVSAIFPLLASILDVLAAKAIYADQVLVESAYHLRKSRHERRK